MNRKASLVLYCKTEDGWKRLPAIIGANGKVSPGKAIYKGRVRAFERARYQVRYYVGSKVRYESVGTVPSEALQKVRQKERLLIAMEAASEAGAVIVDQSSRTSLRRELDRFLDVVRDRGSKVAADVYRLAAEDFLVVTGKAYADQLTEEDVRKYLRELRSRRRSGNRPLSARTVYNRHAALKPFLRHCGLDVRKLAPTAPNYEEGLPEVYTAEEITALFASLTAEYYKLAFTLLLKCGLREQEATYLCWPDVNFSTSILLVRGKPDLGFQVKDKAERALPIPVDLLGLLKAWKESHSQTRLVIGTKTDNPNGKLLQALKRLARRAGLNCGACEGCEEREECRGWYLHKFRATYCTKLLRSGMDPRTVQGLMGHSDIQTTMKYARPYESDAVRGRIEALNWAEN